jgi:hypothetical protein
VAKKIHSDDWKLDGGEQKGPRKPLAAEGEIKTFLSPTRDRGATRSRQGGTTRCRRRRMWINRVGGARVDEETPL